MESLPVSLLVELDHAQHCCHDEEHEYGVQQDVLGNSDAAGVCQEGGIKHRFSSFQQNKCKLLLHEFNRLM